MSKPRTAWTDEDEALLRKLAAEHKTGSQMAKAMGNGRSRNAVIGKIYRLGIEISSGEVGGKRASRAGKMAAMSPQAAKNDKADKARAITVSSSINPQRIPDFKPPTIIPPRPGHGPTVVDLETGMCRAPVGTAGGADQQHCGQETKPVPRGSRAGIGGFETYCPSCARRLQKPTPSRAR